MPVFLLWAITGRTSKQTVHARSEGVSRVLVALVGLCWFVLFGHGFGHPPLSSRFIPMTPVAVYGGLALTVVGLAFAVWARFYIGRNWSPQIEVKQDHQLIQTGPYGIVRHPIYSGFMLATLGTAIAFGEWSGVLSVAMIVGAWGYKARLEEGAMIEQFGPVYELYRARVKGLVPFVY